MRRNERVFLENPYDIETIMDAMKIAAMENKELCFLDQLIGTLHLDPLGDTTDISHRILRKLQLMPTETLI